MYSLIERKKKNNSYFKTMNIIYNSRHYRDMESPQIKIEDRFDKHRIIFRNLLNNNEYSERLNKKSKKINKKNQRNKIDLLIENTYDKYNNFIRDYNINKSINSPKKKFENIRFLTKEKIKDEIILKSNQFFPKENKNLKEENHTFNKSKKEPDYKKIYKIKYIDTGIKEDEYKINQKEGEMIFSKIFFTYKMPINGIIKKNINK